MSATKVTLTLPEDVLAAVDRYVASHQGATRSGVCAKALVGWLQARSEAEVADYYCSMSAEERDEDAAWAALAARSGERLWP